MNVLFMMPGWEDESGPWMTRMMEAFGDDLKAILVKDSKGEKKWKNEVPIFSLRPHLKIVRYMVEFFRMCGFNSLERMFDPNVILQRVIRRKSITHIFCQYGIFADKFMDSWQKTDAALFIHFHGYDQTFDLRYYNQPDKKQYDDSYLRNIKKLSQRAIFIANSKFSKNLLVDVGINESRIKVKYIGTPLSDHKKQHLENKDLKIIQLGRLVDCKSPDRTIKAFEIAKSKGLNATLTLVGDGKLRITCELLRSRSKWKNSIQILGFLKWEDGQHLLSEADIYTQHNIKGELTHQTEALGVSILEAMSFGLPVVGTRDGGVMETVIDGQTGILIDPGDVEAQADAFIKLANHPELRQKLGDAGRERIAKYFNPEQEAILLREIMSRTNNRPTNR